MATENRQPNNVGAVEPGRWYSQAELLDIAHRRGFAISQGQLEKWVVVGLVDRGTQRGLGQGRGSVFRWPHTQAELLLLLLGKQRSVRPLRLLANIPIAIWLYWGEEYVPLRQVRRVMETWAEIGRKRPRHSWRSMARRVLDDVARSDARREDRDAAVELLAELMESKRGDVDQLVQVLIPIVGGDPVTGRNPDAFTDARRAAELVMAQIAGLTRIQEISEEVFNWARAVLLVSQGDYLRQRPALAMDSVFGKLHPPTTFEDFIQRACSHLITAVGLFLAQPQAKLPAPLAPELWTSGRAHLHATATYEPSRLSLPGSVDAGRIRVSVHVELDDDQS